MAAVGGSFSYKTILRCGLVPYGRTTRTQGVLEGYSAVPPRRAVHLTRTAAGTRGALKGYSRGTRRYLRAERYTDSESGRYLSLFTCCVSYSTSARSAAPRTQAARAQAAAHVRELSSLGPRVGGPAHAGATPGKRRMLPCMYIHIHMSMYTYIYIYTHSHTHACTHSHTDTDTDTDTDTRARAHAHTETQTDTHAHPLTRTHTALASSRVQHRRLHRISTREYSHVTQP